MTEPRICAYELCDKPLDPWRNAKAKYCSNNCRTYQVRRLDRQRNPAKYAAAQRAYRARTPAPRFRERNGELWRPIPGYPRYEASTHGRIRSYAITGRPGPTTRLRTIPKTLKLIRNHDGYLVVSVSLPGQRANRACRQARVARLVLAAFIGPPPTESHQASHLNGRKTDNRIENLAWESRAQNFRRMLLHNPERYTT